MTAPNLQTFVGGVNAFNETVIEHKGLVVAEFGTSTCPGCRRVRQLLPSFVKNNPNILFLNVEIDNQAEIRDHFKITSVPLVGYFKLEGADVKQIDQVPQIKSRIASLK
jgi:thiol-disulfide isomerase/thioredoxin